MPIPMKLLDHNIDIQHARKSLACRVLSNIKLSYRVYGTKHINRVLLFWIHRYVGHPQKSNWIQCCLQVHVLSTLKLIQNTIVVPLTNGFWRNVDGQPGNKLVINKISNIQINNSSSTNFLAYNSVSFISLRPRPRPRWSFRITTKIKLPAR